jgi:hypothetical protein
MEISVSLSMATYTPVSFWISMQLNELTAWAEKVAKIVKRGGGRNGNYL